MSRPACFGSAVALSLDCETCRACPGVSACAGAAHAFLEQHGQNPAIARERQRIALIRQTLSSAPGKGEQGAAVPCTRGVPAAVASVIERLHKSGWFTFARTELAAGRNPGRKDWQRVMCERLLRGPVTRAQLIAAFEQELRMTPGSAKVRATKALQIFHAGGLTQERSGYLQIRQN